MAPGSIQLADGRVIVVVNNISSGYAVDATKDYITGKIFVSASRLVEPLVPKDWIVDSDNKTIWSIDFPESLAAATPKFYGNWITKDENGDVTAEKPMGITTGIYVSFVGGKIRTYTTAGVYTGVFDGPGVDLVSLSYSGGLLYGVDGTSNKIWKRSAGIWSFTENKTLFITGNYWDKAGILGITSNSAIITANNYITIPGGGGNYNIWNETGLSANAISGNLIRLGNIIKAVTYPAFSTYNVGGGGVLYEGEGTGIQVGSWGAQAVMMKQNDNLYQFTRERGFLLFNISDVTNVHKAYLHISGKTVYKWEYPGIFPPHPWDYPDGINVYSQNWYPINVGDWTGGSHIHLIPPYAIPNPGESEYKWADIDLTTLLSSTVSFRFAMVSDEENTMPYPPYRPYPYVSMYHEVCSHSSTVYVSRNPIIGSSFTLPTKNWTDLTLR